LVQAGGVIASPVVAALVIKAPHHDAELFFSYPAKLPKLLLDIAASH
jgi:hypothetical protein